MPNHFRQFYFQHLVALRFTFALLGLMAIIGSSFLSCVEPIHPYSAVAPGMWRGKLFIEPNKSITPGIQDRYTSQEKLFDRNDVGILPFLFEVKYENDTSWYIEIQNGEERIPVRDISFGRSKADADEVLKMEFPLYDSYIEAVVKEGIMQGHFVVRSKDNYRIPFSAHHGEADRFFMEPNQEDRVDLDGTWEVTFDYDSEDPYNAIGEFNQQGNRISGTFLTETGDYRYLDGVVEKNKLWMSVFDGAHAFLFHAKYQTDGTLIGIFRSGKHYENNWIAEKNDDAKLIEPDSLSKATLETFSITFPNENGTMTTFPDPSDDGIKILQIMGTWCPNCRDETIFLTDFLKKNPELNIDVTALAFERYKEQADALEAIKRYKEKLDIPYTMLYGGPSSKSAATDILPMIDEVISYPTMIILDKNNKVRRVHTGFSGPATSKFEDFKLEFMAFISNLNEEI